MMEPDSNVSGYTERGTAFHVGIAITCGKGTVRMAERSKALRSGRSPLLWAWVRIPLLTNDFASPFIA